MARRLLSLVGLLLPARRARASESCKTSCSGPRHVRDLEGYDKHIAPLPSCGSPVDVEVQFFLESFDGVDEQHELVTVTGYLRHWWHDESLRYDHDESLQHCDSLSVPTEMIWTPKLYVYNADKEFHQQHEAMTSIRPNGSVFQSIAFHGSLKCPMQYHRMPYDSHGCFLKIGCYDETTRSIRLAPRHGELVYLNETGVGVTGDKMYSPSWFIENERSISNPGIRVKKFWPPLDGDTDIVFLPFTFARRPGYLVRMVLVPSWLFLVVSYTGFFIDPASAPARAAVALLPILIMRTLQGFVFAKLPQVATCVWLIDYLLGSMVLCCYSAVHLAIVQKFLAGENRCKENLNRLMKAKETAKNLIAKSAEQKKFVASLLNYYDPVEGDEGMMSYLAKETGMMRTPSTYVAEASSLDGLSPKSSSSRRSKCYAELAQIRDDDAATPREQQSLLEASDPSEATPKAGADGARSRISTVDFDTHFALNVKRNSMHSPIDQKKISEGDVAVIRYLLNLWEKQVPEGKASCEMVRKCLSNFNIYMTNEDTAKIMCMFLRDKGFDTNHDENQVCLIFSLFMELLFDIEKYEIAVKPPWYLGPWSRRWDVSLQILFPVFVVMHSIIFYALLHNYPENPDIGLVDDMHTVLQWQ